MAISISGTGTALRPQSQGATPVKAPPKRQAVQASDLTKDAAKLKQLVSFQSLGRQLFSDGVQHLSAAQILQMMQAMGIQVPEGVVVTAEVAQIIASGAAVSTALDTAQDVGSVAVPVAAAVKACIALLETVDGGNLNRDQQTGLLLIETAVDIVLIVTSFGANIMADISFCLDLYKIYYAFNGSSELAIADHDAHQAVYDWYNAREALQNQAFIKNFTAYQQGDLSVFDLIDQAAAESPDIFLKYFPQFGADFPSQIFEYRRTETHYDWMGGGEATVQFLYSSTVYDRRKMQDALYTHFLKPVMDPFVQFVNQNPHNISIKDLVLLATIPPYLTNFTPDMDLAAYLQSVKFTPADFHSAIIKRAVDSGAMFPDTTDYNSAFSLNGVDYQLPYQVAMKAQMDMYRSHAKDIMQADLHGDIDYILKFPGAKRVIQSWLSLPQPATLPVPGAVGWNRGPGGEAWQDPNQFFQVLKLMDAMRKSKIMDPNWSGWTSETAVWFGHLDDFVAKHKEMSLKSMMRAKNILAKMTIAFYLNTTPDKLERVNSLVPGEPGIWRIKGSVQS